MASHPPRSASPPATPAAIPRLKYIAHHPAGVQAQVRRMIDEGRLGEHLRTRHPAAHAVRTDRALYDYVTALKSEFLRNADPLSKVAFDSKLHVVRHALGTHTTISRVQGGKLKAKREIRVASLFKAVPDAWLRMIVVHELAHMKERDHDRAFYALCTHMDPDYHQHEFDLRLYLTHLEAGGTRLWGEDQGAIEDDTGSIRRSPQGAIQVATSRDSVARARR